MAFLGKIPMNDARSNQVLSDNGYFNLESCSEDSYWTLRGRHELYIDPNKRIRDTQDLFDLVFREGWRCGDALGKQRLKDDIMDRTRSFLNELTK